MDPNLARILQALAGSSASNPAQTVVSPTAAQLLQHQQEREPKYYPTAPKIDPSTITQWPAALKYVTTNITTNPMAMARLKKMKAHQLGHEKLWWANRVAIIKKHADRVANTQRMNEVLRSFGQTMPTGNTTMTPEQEALELQHYDEKVHRAGAQMVDSMTQDMEAIGVPFFYEKEFPGGKEEQMKLRRRMLEFLDDLLEGE